MHMGYGSVQSVGLKVIIWKNLKPLVVLALCNHFWNIGHHNERIHK